MITWEHYRACSASTHVFHFSPFGTSMSFLSVLLGRLSSCVWIANLHRYYTSQTRNTGSSRRLGCHHNPRCVNRSADCLILDRAAVVQTEQASRTRCFVSKNVDKMSDKRQTWYVVACRQAIKLSTIFCFLSLPTEVAILSDSESDLDSDSEDDLATNGSHHPSFIAPCMRTTIKRLPSVMIISSNGQSRFFNPSGHRNHTALAAWWQLPRRLN